MHVDAGVLGDAEHPGQSVLEDGARVPAEASQRLACDAGRVVMRHGAEGLRMANGAGGVHVDSQTITPGWLGERLDVGWAIDVLHPRANPLESAQSPRGRSPGAERDSG